MGALHQILVVTALNFRSLPSRLRSSFVVVVGMACVVGVLLSMLSLTEGMFAGFKRAGDPERVIVTSGGVINEGSSSLTRDQANMIMDAPGIMKDEDGLPMASFEILSSIPVQKRENGLPAYVLFRGFGPKGIKLRPEIKIVAGRLFVPGKRELIVGVGAQNVYAGLELGDQVVLPDGTWSIVGVFATGDQLEGNLITDVNLAMAAIHRSTFASVMTRLDPRPGSFVALRNALTSNPALSVTVERHSTYYERQMKTNPNLANLNYISYSVGFVMAIGAFFGALNTMYAVVSARTREIGTLRALGFGAVSVAVSVMMESLLLALAGAAIGAIVAWYLFNGVQDNYGVNVFHMSVSPTLIGLGFIWAAAIALLGGLFPSIRAIRVPVAEALRAI